MMVRCPQGQIEEDGGGQRRRSNKGEALPAESCDWTGRCEDLKNHDKMCSYKIITCKLEGCDHECLRKDMSSHLAGDGFIRHMNLMKQSYESKMEDMKQSYESTMEDVKQSISASYSEIAEMKQENKSMQKRITDLEARELRAEIILKVIVQDCGIPEINGDYI
jgi:hypothetical protein